MELNAQENPDSEKHRREDHRDPPDPTTRESFYLVWRATFGESRLCHSQATLHSCGSNRCTCPAGSCGGVRETHYPSEPADAPAENSSFGKCVSGRPGCTGA